eukprot:COSAG01_NODE_3045_length_6671_cov_14.931396_12_plen_182_part_01
MPPRDVLCHDGRRRPNLLATTRTAPNRGNSGRQQVSDPSTLYGGGGATSQSIGVAYWCAVPRRFHTRRRDQAAAGRVAAIERQLEAARARAAEQEAFTASLEDVRASTAAALATQARRAKRQQHSATQQLASARRDASLLGALRQFLRHGASDTAQRRAQQLAASVQALPAQLDSLREEVVA